MTQMYFLPGQIVQPESCHSCESSLPVFHYYLSYHGLWIKGAAAVRPHPRIPEVGDFHGPSLDLPHEYVTIRDKPLVQQNLGLNTSLTKSRLFFNIAYGSS